MASGATDATWWPQDYLGPWLSAQQTLIETLQAAPQVIAMRMAWLSTPPFLWTSTQQDECWRMVSEKQEAMNTGMLAMSDTLGRGMMDPMNSGTLAARMLSAGLRPSHKKVRSNLTRLEQHSSLPIMPPETT